MTKSARPIYLTAAAYIVYALIFPMHLVWHLVLSAVLAIVLFQVLSWHEMKRAKKDMAEAISYGDTINLSIGGAENELLTLGYGYQKRLGELGAAISDERIKGQIDSLQATSRRIFSIVVKQPEQTRKLNTFIDYYYPTTIKLLEGYVELSRGVTSTSMEEAKARITESLKSIELAFIHQLDNLISDKVFDITTDIKVLENIMAREGIKNDIK